MTSDHKSHVSPAGDRSGRLNRVKERPQSCYKKSILPEFLVPTPKLENNPTAEQVWQTITIQKQFYSPKKITSFLPCERNHIWDTRFCFVSASQFKGPGHGPKGNRKDGPLPTAAGRRGCAAPGCCRAAASSLSPKLLPITLLLSEGTEQAETEFEGRKLPARTKGGLSISSFYFSSVLPNHFKFSLFKMWGIIVHTETQCGYF